MFTNDIRCLKYILSIKLLKKNTKLKKLPLV